MRGLFAIGMVLSLLCVVACVGAAVYITLSGGPGERALGMVMLGFLCAFAAFAFGDETR